MSGAGRPLRIAAHNGAPIWGGGEVALARVVAGLERRGHQPMLYCNRYEVARRAAEFGATTRRLHLGGDIAVHTAVRFALALRRQKPDALILGTFRKLWLGALAARLARVPRVVARIGLETDMPRNAKYRWVFRHWVDAVVFNADVMRERFRRELPEFEGDLVTLHTGLPTPAADEVEAAGQRTRGAALRRELGIPEAAPVVGSVGRLAEQKRYDRLVAAVAALEGIHLLLVGDGPEREALRQRATEAGIRDRLHLTGHRDDVAPALAAMDVFVISSDREGMSNAMLEALAAGVPVVSTDVSGAREALRPLEDGVAPGRVVPADADALTGALRELLESEELREGAAAAARRTARERFDETRMLEGWESVLRGGG